MSSNLQDHLDSIKEQKDTYIIPENLKAGVTALGVTGTYTPIVNNQDKTVTSNGVYTADSGYTGLGNVTVNVASTGAKIFNSVAEMQADPSPSEGGLAMIYTSKLMPIQENSEISSCVFPSSVTLSSAVTSTIYFTFESNSNTLDGQITSTWVRFDDYRGGKSSISYTSSDGIHYTRTDGGEAGYSYAEALTFQNRGYAWNSAIGEFIKMSVMNLDGLYKYYADYEDKNKRTLPLLSDINVNFTSGTITYSKSPNTPYVDKKKVLSLASKISSECSDSYPSVLYLDANGNLHITNGQTYGGAGYCMYSTDESTAYPCFGVGGNSSGNDYILDIDNQTYTALTVSFTGATGGNSCRYCNIAMATFPVYISMMPTDYGGSYFGDADHNTLKFSKLATATTCSSAISTTSQDIYIHTTGYIMAETQFSLSGRDQLVSGVCAYGVNGPVTGDGSIANPDNTFYDTPASLFGEIQFAYDNMTPVVLSSGAYLSDNIRCIPVKSDGTPLIDTHNITSMMDWLMNHFYLRSVPAIDTSNVTNMKEMFMQDSGLVSVAVLDTSRVTNMQWMFSDCGSLSDWTLNNIMQMCINAVNVTSNKTLKYLGLTSSQASKCTELSNYSAFTAAGWTTGY